MTNLATVVSALFTQVGNVVDTILEEPILMIGIGIWFAGGAIGLAYRLIRG